MGVGADVAQDQRCAALLGREAPARRRIAVGFGRGREVALDVLDVELADGAERPAFHLRAGVPDHGVAGVVVGQAEHAPARAHALDQVESIGKGRGERLVADHVEASGQRVTRHRVVPDNSSSCAGMRGVSEDQAGFRLHANVHPGRWSQPPRLA
jgi:hypothetical protein